MVGRRLSSTGLLVVVVGVVVEVVVGAVDPGVVDVGVPLGFAPPTGVVFDDVPLFADAGFVDVDAEAAADAAAAFIAAPYCSVLAMKRLRHLNEVFWISSFGLASDRCSVDNIVLKFSLLLVKS